MAVVPLAFVFPVFCEGFLEEAVVPLAFVFPMFCGGFKGGQSEIEVKSK